MLSILAFFVEPFATLKRKRREQIIQKQLSRIRFYSSALDSRLDFSGIHHFPDWIEAALIQVLNLDPSNPYATHIKNRLPEYRARATEIVAMRSHVSITRDRPDRTTPP